MPSPRDRRGEQHDKRHLGAHRAVQVAHAAEGAPTREQAHRPAGLRRFGQWMRRVIRHEAVLLLGWIGIAFVFPTGASAETFTEDAVKAAYLHRLAAYVEWPEHAATHGAFTIGVHGANAVVGQLQRLLPSLTIHGRPAQVRAANGASDLVLTGVCSGAVFADNLAAVLERAPRLAPYAQETAFG